MSVGLMQVIEQIGREKGIERDVLIEAVGAAMLSASRKTLGASLDLRVQFDERSGTFKFFAVRKVVAAPVNPKVEIGLEEAQRLKPDAQLEDELAFELPAEQTGQFTRIAAQTAKQVIIQRVREAEREMVYQSFKEKEGDVVTGVVQRVVKGNVIVSVGRDEAVLPPREQLPREDYRVGDRVRAYVLDVRKTPKGSQVVVSRTHPGFLIKLFDMEVPEIHDGTVEVKAAAREPGERSKIAVTSKDPNVDPVGACVGYRGSRVQAVVRELHGEKIDIIPWRPDPAAFVKTALAPAESDTVTADEANHTLQVVVPDEQLSLAIGKKGVNARLAAKLVGWKVDIKGRSEAQAAAAGALFGDAGEAAVEEAAAEALVAHAPAARSGMEAVGVTDLEAPAAEDVAAGDAAAVGTPGPTEAGHPAVASTPPL
jgi:N utilization substance protein A